MSTAPSRHSGHSPVVILYADALESIFAFGSLKELAVLMAVCRDWQAAVLSLKPSKLAQRFATGSSNHVVTLLCASRLRRHVAHIERGYTGTPYLSATHASPHLLTQHMPHLLSLSAEMNECRQPLCFPHQLHTLRLYLQGSPSGNSISASLTIIAQPPSLEELHFDFPQGEDSSSVSVAPLISMSQLRNLDVSRLYHLSDAQVAQLGQMSQLEVLSPLSELSLRKLPAPGHRLRLRDIILTGSWGSSNKPPKEYDALMSLPTLTQFGAE